MHDSEGLNLSPSPTLQKVGDNPLVLHIPTIMYVEAHPGRHQQGIIYWTRMHILGNGYTRLHLAQTPCTKGAVHEIGLGHQRVGPLGCELWAYLSSDSDQPFIAPIHLRGQHPNKSVPWS